jgi:hypothetical protein
MSILTSAADTYIETRSDRINVDNKVSNTGHEDELTS